VRAPRRWHVRAWCDQRSEFRDFTLGRIASAAYVDLPSSHPQAEDAKWNRKLELVIVAHPGLTIEQQEMIALEYFPGARAMRLSVRECLAAYAIQDLRLALDAEKEAPPEFQLLVSNSRKLPLTFSSERKSV
jgi:predicted DNA-binding transcriptional regulator YafY